MILPDQALIVTIDVAFRGFGYRHMSPPSAEYMGYKEGDTNTDIESAEFQTEAPPTLEHA